jgi:hypothetical protein
MLMIPTLATALLLVQSSWALAADADAARPGDPVRAGAPAAVLVRGDAELTAQEAYDSAWGRAVDMVRDRWRDRAARLFSVARPVWLPESLLDDAVALWMVDARPEAGLRVVDREDRERDHGFGHSYQTWLWVAEDDGRVDQGERQLARLLQRVRRETLMDYGAVAGSWLLLALGLAWLDRLSRGYMTGRLIALGLLSGAAVPVLVFLL